MTSLLHYLLTLVLLYGYPIVACVVFLGYLGLPVPASSVLLAAGSFCVSGSLNIYILIPLVTLTAAIGDVFGYYVGKKVGYKLVTNHGHKVGITKEKMEQVDKHLKKWGGGSIFITRWLITPLGVPVDLLAGIQTFPFYKFIVCAIAGEFVWASLYVGLGYIFGANWQTLLDYISSTPEILALVTVGILLLLFVRSVRNVHTKLPV